MALLGSFVLVAAWLRLTGLTFGLPAVYNPDELAILSRALAFAKGDLNPHNFLYPTFFFYVLFAWIGAAFVVLRVTGQVDSLHAFQTLFFTDPSAIYLAGRTLGVACGVATVVAVWMLARRLFGTRVAVVAALFMAVAPTAVRDAHYIKHDVPVTLLAVVAMLCIARIWPLRLAAFAAMVDAAPVATRATRSTPLAATIAGGACGMALSTHYYAMFLAAPLAIALWWGDPAAPVARRLRALITAGVATLVVFFALSPFLLVEPSTAWTDIVANRQIVMDRSGAGHGRWFPSAGTYAMMLGREAVSWPILALAAWGARAIGRLSWRVGVWFAAFPVLFFLFIANTVAASRYLNPILPFVCLAAAVGVSDLAARFWPARRTLAVAGLAGLAAVPAVREATAIGRFFNQVDTRTLAQRFVEATVPAGATVLIQPYSAPLVQSRESLVEALTARLGDPNRASTKFALRLAVTPWPGPAYRTIYLGDGGLDADKIYVGYVELARTGPFEVFQRLGVDYVVLKRYPVEDPATGPLRAALESRGDLLARFSPYRAGAAPDAQRAAPPFLHNTDTPLAPVLERPGPIMEIWAVR